MGTIGVDEVQRGDILLVTQRPGDPLAELIIDLDRSPNHFSHGGVAGGNGTIISSYPSTLEGLMPVEVGGLHHDPFEHFWGYGQSIHRLVLPDGVDRKAALARLDRYPESRETTFGIAKIVMVAAALHALIHEEQLGEEATGAVVLSAIVAGEAWSSETDFFCAEFAAHIYDLTELPFTVADLRPGGPVRGLEEAARRTLIKFGMQGLLLGRTDEEQETLRAFVATVEEHDPAFFDEGVQVLLDAALHGLGLGRRGAALPDETAVPAALITPRMLAAWGTATEEIRRPGKG